MISVPCKGCPDRTMGCHGRCDKYQKFRAEQTEKNEHEHMLKASAKGDRSWFEKKFRKEAKYGR